MIAKVLACMLIALAGSACGDADEVGITLTLPDVAALGCGSRPPSGLSATLFISGNLAPCTLVVDAAGNASGSCGNVPTGITRYLTLRYAVQVEGRLAPLRYAMATADLTPTRLKGESATVPVSFVDDGANGMYVDDDADVARLLDLLYGPKTELTGAICFTRSVIGSDAGHDDVASDCRSRAALDHVLDLDSDACTNLRELCDGTSPLDASSASACLN